MTFGNTLVTFLSDEMALVSALVALALAGLTAVTRRQQLGSLSSWSVRSALNRNMMKNRVQAVIQLVIDDTEPIASSSIVNQSDPHAIPDRSRQDQEVTIGR